MNDKVYNVLFLCTGNSARSVMAEAMLNGAGRGRFKAYSGGSQPTGKVHPKAIEQIQHVGYSTDGLRSKSWHEFATEDAPQMDFVITVCDRAAGEACPYWPGQPITAHWGFQDPASISGTDDEIHHAFAKICREIKTRLDIFLSLPLHKLERLALKMEMEKIGMASTLSNID
jgi:arsenate reductase